VALQQEERADSTAAASLPGGRLRHADVSRKPLKA
jgi:hypothetical protein